MDFDKLQTFINVVETGSFQKTSENLFISQRAVSKAMQKLEEEIGFSLFIRGKNKIQITDQGHKFYLKVKEMLNSFTIEINTLKNQSLTSYQEIRIGYFSPFEGAMLRKQMVRFRQQYPFINLIVTEESLEHLISDVSLGIIDIAYVLDYGIQEYSHQDIEAITVFKSTMVMGVSKSNLIAKNKEITLQDLSKKPILYYSAES